MQSNKARKAVELFDVIQSIDSLKLALKINNIAEESNKVQRIMMQVNTGNDPAKYGFSPTECPDVSQELNEMHNIQLEGIMMIPPLIKDTSELRSIFSQTQEIQKNIAAVFPGCNCLSMGMTADYPLAIEEGATHVRIGTALFGERVFY